MQMNHGKCDTRTSTGGMLQWPAAAFAFLVAVAPLGAQWPLLTGANAGANPRGGFQLYDVTGYAGWESILSPRGGGFYLPSAIGLKGDETLGGGATAGWSRHGKKGNVSLVYSAMYQAQIRYSNLSALNQFLTLNASRQLNAKWTLGFSAAGGVSTYDQMLFTPTIFSNVLAVPGTFDDLAAAVLAGKYTNDQLASLLTGAPVIESPARTLFFGDRVFTSAAATSLSYAHSQRLSISFSASANRAEHLQNGEQPGAPQYLYLLPQAIEGSSTVAINYSLTPRTQVGVNVSASRGFSRVQDAYTTYGSAFLGRTMGRHWFAQVHAGGGFITQIRSRYTSSNGATPVFGGSLGFKTFANTIMVSGDRTLSQSYGVGAADTTAVNAAWQWWRPGRRWGTNASYLKMHFTGGPFGTVDGWRSSFGVNRRIGEHLMLETAYSYGSYSSDSPPSPYQSSQNAVRLSMTWMPQEERP
jgi:hypothetical protein